MTAAKKDAPATTTDEEVATAMGLADPLALALAQQEADELRAELATTRTSLAKATAELEALKAKAAERRGGLLQGEGRMTESVTFLNASGVSCSSLVRDVVTTHGAGRAKELQHSLGTYARAYAIDSVTFEELVSKKLVEVA